MTRGRWKIVSLGRREAREGNGALEEGSRRWRRGAKHGQAEGAEVAGDGLLG